MESSLIQICEHNVSKTVYTIKDKSLKLLSFMERETRLELATSSLARRHSTTELPPHRVTFLLYMSNFFLQVFFQIYTGIASSCSLSLLSIERISISSLSLNCFFSMFTRSFVLSTQKTEAVSIFTSSS